MTTTLRPAGPEERGPDGSRARDFTVCVNSRPVGAIRLATDERFGPAHGRIVSLAVDPPDRRRGRGCVAAAGATVGMLDSGADMQAVSGSNSSRLAFMAGSPERTIQQSRP